ncbi:MAG: site-specific DNA-methyltransferase [Methanobrevibacter sp. CfCl-M3]
MIESKLNGESLDILSENIAKLKELFPEILTEDKIDFDKLKTILSDEIDDSPEKYNFTWHGKGRAIVEAQKPSTGTLRPVKEESKDWNTTKNLYVEGDNLEVLKLLQKTYFGKIDMIYIDPPYNTGNDFVYPDNYVDNLENYLEISGQAVKADSLSNDQSSQLKMLSTNTETNGRFHTDWINMMYPRLKLARNLLKTNGVIFISIDDSKVNNLKKICDEIFGEDNFETSFYIKIRHENRILRADNRYQFVMEQVLCYSKSKKYYPNRIPKETNPERDYIYDINILNSPKEYLKINNYDIEVYSKDDYEILESSGGEGLLKKYQIRGSLISQSGSASEFYEINLRKRRTIDGEGTLYKIKGMGVKGDGLGYRFIMQPEKESSKNGFYFQGRPLTSKKNVGLPFPNYFDFVKEANNVGYEGDIEFKNGKKPLNLIKKIFDIGNVYNKNNATVMDFFSGSSSTAHAVMQLNSETNGNRKYIMIQLPQDENGEAYKKGFKNICEIGKERIRRAGEKIKSESNNEDLDIGFKVFKLDSSNLKKWDPDYKNPEQAILTSINNIKEDRTEFDLLYEIMLKYGIDLTLPIEEYDVNNKKIYSVGFGALLICLDDEITSEISNEIIKLKEELNPETICVVFKDNGFISDSDKTNIKETLKTNDIDEFITI